MFKRLAPLKDKIARISGDFIINILASLIYTFARQIVVFPLLAAQMTDADYGTLLTVSGLVNVATAMVGNVLNNVRLIQDSTYREKGIKGDFHLLCMLGSLVSVVYTIILGVCFQLNPITTALLCVHVCAGNFYQYAIAHFRLNLDFKRIFVTNCLISLTYILFALICADGIWWPMVLVAGECVGLVYVAAVTRFHQEGLQRTEMLGDTTKKMLTLMMGSLLSNLMLYADRVLIYPIIGAESVSYYSAASLFGKSAGLVMTPIAGVLLGYYSQKNFKASKKLFALVNGLSLLCAAAFMCVCWVLAPWFTKLLYPTLFEQAEPYIVMANLGAVVGIIGSMAKPMILRCCSTKWILIIQIVHAIVYLILALWLMPLYGLWGFCWAMLLSSAVNVVLMYVIGFIKF